MLPVEEVLAFARDYLNDKQSRSRARKQKIRTVYKELFGKDINGSCSTCYIEAMLEIVKSFKKINMATPNYELKRGVLLESFGHPEKTCTNDTITDALAEWHLRECPAKAVLFARMPGGFITPVTIPVPPPQPPVQSFRGERQIVPAAPIIIPPSKIAQEDQVKRKALVDKAMELGFKSSPESPIELMTSSEIEVIIPNLEKAKLDEVKTEIPVKKSVKKTTKAKK
jgi:hypothetical protein